MQSSMTRPVRAFSPACLPQQRCYGGSLQGLSRHLKLRSRPLTSVRNSDEDNLQETKLGPNVLAGVRELRENLEWSKATIVRNDAADLDGSQRLLHLSIEDRVDLLYGLKIQGKRTAPRWIDSYTVPGQFVSVRLIKEEGDSSETTAKQGEEGDPRHSGVALYSIASSPYQSRSDSAYLDSSLIQIVVNAKGDSQEQQLALMGPGALIEVSQVVGRGFASLFTSYMGLPSALEEGSPLLIMAVGCKGLAPCRAVLNWTPLLAHAGAHRVVALYVADSLASAAFVKEWDSWRDAGVDLRPLYMHQSGGSEEGPCITNDDAVLDRVLTTLLQTPGGIPGLIGGKASSCTVLVAGVVGSVATGLSRALTAAGVQRERILFCDYF